MNKASVVFPDTNTKEGQDVLQKRYHEQAGSP